MTKEKGKEKNVPKTIYISPKQDQWIDSQPRDFNFSDLMRDLLDDYIEHKEERDKKKFKENAESPYAKQGNGDQ